MGSKKSKPSSRRVVKRKDGSPDMRHKKNREDAAKKLAAEQAAAKLARAEKRAAKKLAAEKEAARVLRKEKREAKRIEAAKEQKRQERAAKRKGKKTVAPEKPASKKKSDKPAKPKQPGYKARSKKIGAVNPAPKLKEIAKGLSKLRSPIYRLNSKIRKTKDRKILKELKAKRAQLEAQNSPGIEALKGQRKTVRTEIKKYDTYVAKRQEVLKQLAKVHRKRNKADEETDYDALEKLGYQEMKLLGDIYNLDKGMGIADEQDNPEEEKDEYDREDQEGGANYILDGDSPYPVWKAAKQLLSDLDSGEFKYYVIDGTRYSKDNEIQITADATSFWIDQKGIVGDSDGVINRFLNLETMTVKYKVINS